MTSADQWKLFFAYWAVAAVLLGWGQLRWMKRRREAAQPITAPIGQFVFVVTCAPLALAIVAGLVLAVLGSL